MIRLRASAGAGASGLPHGHPSAGRRRPGLRSARRGRARADAENLTFDRTEDGDLAFALAGDWKDYELWFAWRPEADCLQLCLSLDLRVEQGRARRRLRAAVADQPARLAGPLRGVGRGRRDRLPPLAGPAHRRAPDPGPGGVDDRRGGRGGGPLLSRPSTSCCAARKTPQTPWPPACSRPWGGRNPASRRPRAFPGMTAVGVASG